MYGGEVYHVWRWGLPFVEAVYRLWRRGLPLVEPRVAAAAAAARALLDATRKKRPSLRHCYGSPFMEAGCSSSSSSSSSACNTIYYQKKALRGEH